MRLWIALCLALISAGAEAQQQQRPSQGGQDRVRPYTKVEGWRIATLVNNGRFNGCAASSNFVDGTTFFIGFGARWWLGLTNASWQRQEARQLPIRIAIDGREVHSGTAVQKDRLVVMTFSESQDSIASFMAGQNITFVSAMGRSTFSLKGSSKATAALIDCVNARGNGAPLADGGGGGAFGQGSTSGSTGAADKRIASRAQTIELAASYLGKLGTPYTLLEANANILKNFPVNWTFPDGGLGGMVVYSGAAPDSQKFFDNFVADNARLCKGTSGLTRQPPATNDNRITRFSAVGNCQEGERAYVTDFTVIAGPELLVAIVNIGTRGASGTGKRMEENKKWSL